MNIVASQNPDRVEDELLYLPSQLPADIRVPSWFTNLQMIEMEVA